MEISTTTIPIRRVKETVSIHHLTDLHDGAPDHAEQELNARIEEIAADPLAFWVGGGDYGDLILPTDKRFSPSVVSEPFRESMARIPDFFLERMEARLRPIADKCLGLAAGNHEATIGKNYHRGVAAELAMRLGIAERYLGDRGWSILTFDYRNRRIGFSCYAYHGWSAGRLKGRKALQAERDLGAWSADALFLGHDHQPYADIWWMEEPYSTKSGWRIRHRPRAVINGGSWTYGQKPPSQKEEKLGWRASSAPGQSWVEGKNFRPQPPSSPVLLVHLDFGSAGRQSGFDLEIRQVGRTHYVGGDRP